MQNKKGIQLSEAVGAILALILIGMAIIVSIITFVNLNTATLAKNTAGSGVNETVVVTTAGTPMYAASLVDGSCGTITTVYNATGYALNSGNYTQTGCNLANKTSAALYGTSWRVSYPYTYSAATSASNASNSFVTTFATYPALVGLVGTIIFLGIVIGVLVASFVFGGNGKA